MIRWYSQMSILLARLVEPTGQTIVAVENRSVDLDFEEISRDHVISAIEVLGISDNNFQSNRQKRHFLLPHPNQWKW